MCRNLKARSRQEEIMDDFHGSEDELLPVLEDISRVNKMLGGNGITLDAVRKLIAQNPKESYTIMDVGCGDGTMLRSVADYCRANQIKTRLIGIDLNSMALEIGRRKSVDYPEISYREQDILTFKPADEACDILISTLTTHHFTNEQLPVMLAQFARLPKIGFVNNDLQRSGVALFLFTLFKMIFIRTRTARIDGAISIRRGFKKRELINFAKQLPGMRHHIKWKWAFRFVWIMQPNRPKGL